MINWSWLKDKTHVSANKTNWLKALNSKRNRSIFKTDRQRTVILAVCAVIVAGIAIPMLARYISASRYKLSVASTGLLDKANTNLAAKITYDQKSRAYYFNKKGLDAAPVPEKTTIGTKNGPNPAAVLKQMQSKIGGTGKQDKSLYAVEMPEDPSKGMTYHDINLGLSFTMVALAKHAGPRLVDNRVVYPAQGAVKIVYTAKTNGLKEDVIVPKFQGDTLEYKYTLQLPKELEARLRDDGSLGIFSADPAFFGTISYGSPEDETNIQNARLNGKKNHLVFAIPAPIINQTGNKGQGNSHASFKLEGTTLTVKAVNLKSLSYPITIDPSVVITSASDFGTGNNEGDIDFSTSGDIKRQETGSGNISLPTVVAWTATTALTTVRYQHTSVAYNGYLYIIGGTNGTTYYNDVQYAPINANGTIGAWTATTAFTTARSLHTSVAYNGYLYVIGGYNGTIRLNDVQYAPINANGTIGTWTSTTAFTTGRGDHTSVAYNGYLYVIGGGNNSTYFSDVQYAPINAIGTIGTWTPTTALPAIRGYHTSVVYKGYLYVIGGFNGTTAFNDVQFALINAIGTIGTWTTSTAFVTARYGHTSVVSNGYLYVIGGSIGASNLNDVQLAPINANGTIGTWTATTSFTTVRNSHTSVVYNGYLYVIGGDNAGTHLNDVQYAKLGGWQDGGSTFTTARQFHTSVAYNGYLYVIGGTNATSSLNDVQYAPINANGTIGIWTVTTALTTTRDAHTSVVYNGYLYVIGGFSGTYLNDVQYAPINANGTIGSWATTTAFTNARIYHTSVVYNGYLYVIGGSSGTTFNDVQYAPINANGTIGAWATTTAFTNARNAHTSVVYNGYLYVIGGNNAGTYYNDVQYAPISANGTIGTWTTTTAFTTARNTHTSVVYNGYLYVIGGSSGITLNDVQYAPINANGTIGTWTTTTAFTTARYTHTSVVYNGYLYVIGGYDGTTYYNDVQYASADSLGAAGYWATNTPLASTGGGGANAAQRYGHTSVVNNGFIYILGGFTAAARSNVQYAPINNNGTIGTWTATTAFTTARSGHTSVVYDGYIYVIGGISGASVLLNDVQFALINANGTIGTWTATTAYTTARTNLTSVAYKGYLYVMGGTGASYYNDVQYAPFNADNSIGIWTATTAFSTARSQHTSVAYNGYLYVIGGYDGTTRRNDVQYAAINTNGTVGAWTTTTAFSTARSGHTSVVFNGNLYVIGGFGGAYYNDVQYAPLNTDGSLGNWSATTSFTSGRNQLASVVFNGFLYVVGGFDGVNPLSDTQSARLSQNGITGTWATTAAFTTARSYHTSVANNGYLYVIGGNSGTTYYNDVQYAPINVNGTIGTWATTTAFTTARGSHTSVVYNSYLYVIGGYNGTYFNDVQYAPINANGTIGTWATTTAFSNARWLHTSVIYNGYLYVIGGNNAGTYYNDVQYAPINASGTIGTWATTTAFTTGRFYHTSVAYNGYLYVIGGNGSAPRSDVQFAPINANGTIGTWVFTTSFTNARGGHTSVAYNGYLYVIGGNNAGTAYSDVQYAPINVNGTIGTWTGTAAFTTARYYHTSVTNNGYVYVIGGFSTVAQNDVQYSLLNSKVRKARYSKLVDFGSLVSFSNISYTGTLPGGKANISFRSAGVGGVLSASQAATTLGGTCGTSVSSRYALATLTLDDTDTAAWTNAIGTPANLQDITLDYLLTGSSVNPALRLHGGKTFLSTVQQPLDTLKSLGGGC